MEKEKLKFKIDQLRKDKIIWGVEMTGVNTAVILGVILTNQFVTNEIVHSILIAVGCFFGILYSMYASIGNAMRHFEIKKLEKNFYDEYYGSTSSP